MIENRIIKKVYGQEGKIVKEGRNWAVMVKSSNITHGEGVHALMGMEINMN